MIRIQSDTPTDMRFEGHLDGFVHNGTLDPSKDFSIRIGRLAMDPTRARPFALSIIEVTFSPLEIHMSSLMLYGRFPGRRRDPWGMNEKLGIIELKVPELVLHRFVSSLASTNSRCEK